MRNRSWTENTQGRHSETWGSDNSLQYWQIVQLCHLFMWAFNVSYKWLLFSGQKCIIAQIFKFFFFLISQCYADDDKNCFVLNSVFNKRKKIAVRAEIQLAFLNQASGTRFPLALVKPIFQDRKPVWGLDSDAPALRETLSLRCQILSGRTQNKMKLNAKRNTQTQIKRRRKLNTQVRHEGQIKQMTLTNTDGK